VADIPVKPRRAGLPTWLWPVIAILLALVAWLVIDMMGEDDGADAGGTEEVGTAAPFEPAGAPLSFSLSTLTPVWR
jgi:hypothetical protein